MKAENETTGHNRTIRITDLPKSALPLGALVITIGYTKNSEGAVIDKAVTLDRVVIPEIIRLLNLKG